jgi:hypothetical protein
LPGSDKRILGDAHPAKSANVAKTNVYRRTKNNPGIQ